ncbi:MAG: trigger factor [Chitinophagales bacterium]|nr:hypothetical protein [Bacteroidota bacterium]MCB9044259.1 hypothetical protein [Chitinophagales bacterium]
MKITREDVDKNYFRLSIELTPEDYQQEFEKALKKYARSVQIKGFRPGTAPTQLIKHQYGNEILFDTLQNELSNKLDAYLKENEINLFRSPVIDNSTPLDLNVNNPSAYNFTFDIGTQSNIEIPYENIVLQRHIKNVTVQDVENFEKDVLQRYSTYEKVSSGSEVADKGIFSLQIKALNLPANENGETPELVIEELPVDNNMLTEEGFNTLKSHQENDTFNAKFYTYLKEAQQENFPRLLKTDLDKTVLADLDYEINIKEIKKFVPAELNEDFYQQLNEAEGTDIHNQVALRAILEESLKNREDQHSWQHFYPELRNYLIKNITIDYSKDFAQKFVRSNNPELSAETLAEEWDKNYDSLIRWLLIEEKVQADEGISVSQEEVLSAFMYDFEQNIPPYLRPYFTEEMITKMASEKINGDKQTYDETYRQVLTSKLLMTVKDKIKIEEVYMSADDFNQKYHPHGDEHHHHH